MAESPFKPGVIVDPKAAYAPPSQPMSVRQDQPMSIGLGGPTYEWKSATSTPFRESVTKPTTEAGFKPEAVQPKPSPPPEAKKPPAPPEMNLPEATAERYSTPVMPTPPMPIKKEVKEKAEKAGFRPEQPVVLAYRPPEYAMTSEPASAYLERVMATPKWMPERYTEPQVKEGLLSVPSRFSAGQMQMVEQLPFYVVVAPAMAAYTVLKPQAVVSSIVEHPTEFAGAMSLPLVMRGASSAMLKLKSAKVSVSTAIETQQLRYFEGSDIIRGESKGAMAVGKGESKVLYTYESQTGAKVRELTARQTATDAGAAIRMEPIEGGKQIRAYAKVQSQTIRIDEIRSPETFRTYSKGVTTLASEKTGMPTKPEMVRGRGGMQKVSEMSYAEAENLISVAKYKGVDASQSMKAATATVSDTTVVKLKPLAKTTVLPDVAAPTELPQMKPFKLGLKQKPDVMKEAELVTGAKSASDAARTRAIKQAKEQYAGYEPLQMEDVRAVMPVTREEAFVGTQSRAVFQEPKMASERLAGMMERHEVTESRMTGVARVWSGRAGREQAVIPVSAQLAMQRRVQVQEQQQKLRQKLAEPQKAKMPIMPKIPTMLRMRIPMPRMRPPSMMDMPVRRKERKFRISMPEMIKGKFWSLGVKPRETGLADVVYGTAIGKGKPIATGAYGFAIRPKRRKR